MNTLKRFALLCALVCALAVSSLAQSASDITISGVLYNAFNDPCTSCTFTVTVTRRDGVAVQSAPKTVTSNSSTGAISFTLPRKSLVLFLGNYSIGKYNLKQGVTFFVPDQASADIVDLQSVDDAIAALTATTAAPSTADFIVGTANGSLSAEQSLGALTTGLLKNTVSGSTGTLSTATAGTDYQSPISTASSSRITFSSNTIDLATSGVTAGTCTACDLTIDAYGRVTAKANGSGGSGTWGSITGTLSSQADLQSALNLKANLISPSFTTPALGTPSAAVLTNATGLPISTGVSGLGAGAATFLGTPSSANLASALTDETGTGAAVFGTSPDFTTGATIGGVAIPTISSTSTLTNKTISGASNTLSNIGNSSLTNSAITINAGTNFGITAPGSSSLGATVTIGATTDNLRFANLGLGVAAPTSGGQITSTLGANNVTGLLIKRNTDTSPTGKFFDFQNAAGTTVASMGVDGALTVASCSGCGGSSGVTVGTTTITSGTSGRVLYNNAGVVGEMTTSGTGTQLALTASPTFTGTLAGAAFTASSTITQTSASATAFESGPNGGTNPVFRLVNNTASAATGLSITGNAAGSGVTLTALSSGSNEDITLTPKGTGRLRTTGIQGAPFLTPADATTTGFGAASGGGNPEATVSIGGAVYFQAKSNLNAFTKPIALGTDPNNPNVQLFTTGSSGVWRYGATDAASPVAQTLSVQNVVAGTSNTAGSDWTFKGSAGTGTGAGGAIDHQVAPAGTSGTSQNSFVSAFKINGNTSIQFPSTVTAGGTTGNQTINKASGTVNFAAAATSLTVTNSLVTANSIVFAVVRTNDATAVIKNVVPSSGSFVITLNAAATAETSVGFFVINQ